MKKIILVTFFLLVSMVGVILAESPKSIVDEVGTREGSKVYILNGKEYFVSCPYTTMGKADFTVNGERASKRPGWEFMSAGDKWIFSDESSLTFLGIREVYQEEAPKKLIFCKFKLEAPPEAAEQNCNPSWICKGKYKLYVSSDCFQSNKEHCKYGCLDGQCLTQTCSTGWKCKDNYNKAYQNSDCTWSNLEYCPVGCANGECISEEIVVVITDNTPTTSNTSTDAQSGAQQICQAGWICKDSATRAYRSKNCVVSSETRCSYGCTNGACRTNPNVGAAITDTTGQIECGTFCWIGRLFASWFFG